MVEIFFTSVASSAPRCEIELLNAIGAKNRTVLTIFLTETALIGVIGGLIGAPTGLGLANLLSHVLSGFITHNRITCLEDPRQKEW